MHKKQVFIILCRKLMIDFSKNVWNWVQTNCYLTTNYKFLTSN
jgi:hypothetical protein